MTWFRVRTEARRRWRAWLGLAVTAGIAAGIVLAALAGARRTDDAYTRFLAASQAADVVVATGVPGTFDFATVDLDKVAALPEVAAATHLRMMSAEATLPDGTNINASAANFAVPSGPGFGTTMNRARIIDGRAPDPSAVDEIEVSFVAAERFHLHVGDSMPAGVATFEQLAALLSGTSTLAPANEVTLHVVGIDAAPVDFPPLQEAEVPWMNLTPAFASRFADRAAVDFVAVRLRNGAADVPAFQAGVQRLAGGQPGFMFVQGDKTSIVQRSVHVEATALRLLAALLGVAAALVVGQALLRQSAFEASDAPTLRAIGMTDAEIARSGVVRSIAIAVVGAGVAVALAILLSPLAPIGVARRAEPTPGFRADGTVLWPGAVAVLILLAAVGAATAAIAVVRTRSDGSARAKRPSRVAGTLAALGAPVSAVLGTRMALESSTGRSAAPVRTAVAGATLVVAAALTAAVLSASLVHLVDTPRLYGWSWDLQLGDDFAPEGADGYIGVLMPDPAVTALSVGTSAHVTVDSVATVAVAVDPVKGALAPPLLAGDSATASDEVVLGRDTARAAGVGVGDAVDLAFGGKTVRLRVVGIGVFTDIAGQGLGAGAFLTLGALSAVAPDIGHNIVFARLDHSRALSPASSGLLEGLGESGSVHRPLAPADIEGFEHITGLPAVLGGLLVAVGLAVLGHTLVVSIRRRGRDLAVLRALGLSGRQVGAAVAWQATMTAAVGGLIGIPVGAAIGLKGWSLFAQHLAVVNEPRVGSLAVVLALPALAVLLNAIAIRPGHRAARTPPAVILRAE